MLSQPEQVTTRMNSCVDDGVDNGDDNDGSDDDDDENDDGDCSESTNDSIPQAFRVPQKKKMTCTEARYYAKYKIAKAALAAQQSQKKPMSLCFCRVGRRACSSTSNVVRLGSGILGGSG